MAASFDVFARQGQAPKGPTGTGKSGIEYVSFGVTMNEFRSVELVLDTNVGYDRDGDYVGSTVDRQFPITAQTWGAQFTYGSYINDYFLTELRAGTSFKDDTIREALDVEMAYWFAWYIGFAHPITEYASGFFKYGISHYEADTTRRQVYVSSQNDSGFDEVSVAEPSPERMEDGLFGTSFSPTWMIGLDFSIVDNWYLTFEYGRLLKDQDSNIKVRQHGMAIKYEF